MQTMQIHQLKPQHKKKEKKRVGRGGKRGTYSGRGCKGQKARAGRKLQPLMREVFKKYPKLRGYRSILKPKAKANVTLAVLEKKFQSGDCITPQVLVAKKIVRRFAGKPPVVKILEKGEITKALIIKNCLLSKSAKDKIEKAGGAVQ